MNHASHTPRKHQRQLPLGRFDTYLPVVMVGRRHQERPSIRANVSIIVAVVVLLKVTCLVVLLMFQCSLKHLRFQISSKLLQICEELFHLHQLE